jgi:hypothetical protein
MLLRDRETEPSRFCPRRTRLSYYAWSCANLAADLGGFEGAAVQGRLGGDSSSLAGAVSSSCVSDGCEVADAMAMNRPSPAYRRPQDANYPGSRPRWVRGAACPAF